jgi:hypothetical protein
MAWFDAHDYFVFEASTEPPPPLSGHSRANGDQRSDTETSVGLPADRPRRIDCFISYFGDPIRHGDDTAQPGPSRD